MKILTFDSFAELPEDTMCHITSGNYRLYFSESAKLWYLLQDLNREDCCFALVTSGNWFTCASVIKYAFSLYDVPFIWGKPIKSKHQNNHFILQYTPFYEDVESGRYTEDGCSIKEQRFYILKTSICTLPDDSIRNQNEMTDSALFQYDTDMFELIYDLSCFTGNYFFNGYTEKEER